jgi:hypothetical protein
MPLEKEKCRGKVTSFRAGKRRSILSINPMAMLFQGGQASPLEIWVDPAAILRRSGITVICLVPARFDIGKRRGWRAVAFGLMAASFRRAAACKEGRRLRRWPDNRARKRKRKHGFLLRTIQAACLNRNVHHIRKISLSSIKFVFIIN